MTIADGKQKNNLMIFKFEYPLIKGMQKIRLENKSD